MTRIKSVLMTVFFICLCVPCFADAPAFVDLWPEFFDVLPWDVKTGEYKDGRDVKEKINGENSDKERSEEEVVKEKEGSQPTEEVQSETKKEDVKSIDLVVILDRSGSMSGMEKDTIGGFNTMLKQQKERGVPVKVTLITFNQEVTKLHERKPLEEVKDLTEAEYTAMGTTALLDAVGNALSGLKADPEVNAEGNKVLVVITTDGYENASKEWTWSKVRALIKNLEAGKGYQFVFLGADINAGDVAENMGIRREASMKYKKTAGSKGGVQANFRAVSTMVETVSAGNNLVDDMKWKNDIVEDKN